MRVVRLYFERQEPAELRRSSWWVDAPIRSKKKSQSKRLAFGADYVSRQKRLITVFAVANAQEQGAEQARLALLRYATMFQALELEEAEGFMAGGRPYPLKKEKPVKTTGFWSGLRGSNPPPPPWQGGALPNELNPQAVKKNGDSDGARTHDL